MESRRAPALQRDQQELDWPPAGQLPDDLELHSHYDDSKGPSGQGVFGPKKIQNWNQGCRRTNEATANRPGYELAQVELHDKPQKECELIFAQALRVRGKVAWIQRPRTVRQLFQVALELDVPGNAWGVQFPPDDWFSFPEDGPFFPNAVAPADLTGAALPPAPGEVSIEPLESDPVAPVNLRVF